MSKIHTTQKYDAIVVGAGFSGLYQLYRLREMGLNVHAFDAAGGVGGTWYWNRYPGARADNSSEEYQYYFSDELLEEWKWSERFTPQSENERYLNYVADKFDLRKDITLNTRVTAAWSDEPAGRWLITTDTGDAFDAQFFVSCAGFLSEPSIPFPGHERFKGMFCHMARWPKEPVDFTDKRVGVVGNGSGGVQIIQSVAPLAGHLTVFQRTPTYSIPMRNPKLGEADHEALRKRYPELKKDIDESDTGALHTFKYGSFHDHTPEERREIYETLWKDGSLRLWHGTWTEAWTDEKANAEVSEFVREKIRASVRDPELAERLVPKTYGFGTRRVALNTGYYEAYNRDNVELVDVWADPIACITEAGVKLASGTEHALDILILATGFDGASGALTRIDIRGRNGASLGEKWAKELRTTLGVQMHGFPNLFAIGAPLGPMVFCNGPICATQQADWIADAIGHVRANGLSVMEPTAEKEDEWVRHHDEMANITLMPKTDSWYTGTNVKGKTRRLIGYIGGVKQYRQFCEELKRNGYQGFALT